MARYTALIDGEAGAYGVVIPDLPGCTAMGDTVERALINAVAAVRDWIEVADAHGDSVAKPRPIEALRRDVDVAEALIAGATLASVPHIRETGRPAKANLSIDDGILAAIDEEAGRQKLTRSAFIEMMAKRLLSELG
jgi:predicted RNase H-like HicB family nuclease